MTKRGDTTDEEIALTASRVAGFLSIVFKVEKRDILERVRPVGTLRAARDVMMYVLHKRFDFTQPRIASRLGRDRGTVSKGAQLVEDAADQYLDIAFALKEIGDQIDAVIDLSDAWLEALVSLGLDETLARIGATKAELAAEADDDFAALEPELPKPISTRCHECRGAGTVRVHKLGGDPKYRLAWLAAEAIKPSGNGLHDLTCKVCGGATRVRTA